jgi:hypothetical protein
VAPARHLLFGNTSCFILSDGGAACVRELTATRSDSPVSGRRIAAVCPVWVKAQRTLFWENHVVLDFRRAAPNREAILSAFEAEHWPEHLPDVVTHFAGRKSLPRLHDAVKNLNRMQRVLLIRFAGDGTGRGVCWKACPRESAPIPATSP